MPKKETNLLGQSNSDGITPEQHGLLNKPLESFPGGIDAKRKLVGKLRKTFLSDPRKFTKELFALDIYDPDPNPNSDDFFTFRDGLTRISTEGRSSAYIYVNYILLKKMRATERIMRNMSERMKKI